jgi:4-hydroxy-tetrahydrodipicolinate synthase
MPNYSHMKGVFAAGVTPLRPDFSLDLDSVPRLLEFLYKRGCHGILILGTTGEGPSFSPEERLSLFRVAVEARRSISAFRILAGTGTPSLEETISLTRAAFELEMDGAVVLPPYYFRKVSDDGLFTWFAEVLKRAVPSGGILLGYHIPQITGVSLSLDLVGRLKDAFPDKFAGIKDSSGDIEHARQLGKKFGKDLLIYNGNDPLFSQALEAGASGCITALANVYSPASRRIFEAYQQGTIDIKSQECLVKARDVLEHHMPAASFIKTLLTKLYHFPHWTVRPPLLPLSEETVEKAIQELPATG